MLRRFSVDYWSAGEQSITVSSDDMDFLAVFVGNLQVPPRAPNENERQSPLVFLYKENHALDAWFKKAYGDEKKSLLRL